MFVVFFLQKNYFSYMFCAVSFHVLDTDEDGYIVEQDLVERLQLIYTLYVYQSATKTTLTFLKKTDLTC